VSNLKESVDRMAGVQRPLRPSPPAGPSPWERQFGETRDGYLAFSTYRDMGPDRSLARAAELHYEDGASRAKVVQFEKWSAEHDWVLRTDAWDMDQERERRERIQAQRVQTEVEQFEFARQALRLARKRVDDLLEDGGRMTVAEIAKLADVSVKIARLVMGEATSINEEKPRTFDQYIRDLQESGYEPTWG